MTTRTAAPLGAPCWADLWTSDVDGSRRFYSQLFGWVAEEPSPEFGGYFMFTREGVPVCGAMGDMGDTKADDSWKPFMCVTDTTAALAAAGAAGAEVVVPAMPIADLGIQGAVVDPSGAPIGLWQPQSFPGFTVLGEPGAPAWFELHTPDFEGAVSFYESVFGWATTLLPPEHGIRYAIFERDHQQYGGIFDKHGGEGPDGPAFWAIYWHVADTDETLATAVALGGAVHSEAQDTPFGRMAEAADPSGARFWVIA